MKNLGIGARLTLGFALVLMLMVAATAIGIWRLQGAAHAVRDMQQQPIAKDRLVSDWYRTTSRGVLRTIAIAKSADPALATYFQTDAVESAKVNDEIQKQLDVLVAGGEEKAIYDEISKRRKLFLSARDALMKDKAEGRVDDSTKTFEQVFMPNAKAYLAAQESMLAMQRKTIDDQTRSIERMSAESTMLLIGFGVAALVLGALYAWLLTRSITRPLNRAVRIAETVATGDLTSEIEVNSSAETGKLLRALKAMNESLKATVAQVRTGTEAIAGASAEIASGNADLSRRTEQQAANLEETASSMEELTSTVKQNAQNARQANELAASASQVAVRGGTVVGEVVQTMSSINESSKKIADIIGVIDGIAFQTNILALNAAVEAARAGEQGRGFAVVASEVRTLAQRSASAAKEIKQLISESVGKVEDGTRLVDQAGKTMEEIVGAVKRVTDIIGDISAASDEQSSGIEQVNTAVMQMDQMTQQNAALVEEAAAAAESMREQAQGLGAAVSVFKLAPAAEAAAVEVERRGPNRAKNVTRLPAKPKAEPKGKAESAGTPAPKKTGTGDDWSEF